MDDPRATVTAPPSFGAILGDPCASFALKAVLSAWSQRDWLDAAEDARMLARVFEAESDRLIRRLTWPSR
ncbi:hypothetical protein [Brevundimonas intermedia]|uniref:hypothetical protein n=1 Tax=Brevundimonas intermedia TaxID=74315 RepID=UPI00320970B4